MVAAEALPVGRFFVDAAATDDELASIGFLEGFGGGFTVDDANNFSSTFGAFARLAAY